MLALIIVGGLILMFGALVYNWLKYGPGLCLIIFGDESEWRDLARTHLHSQYSVFSFICHPEGSDISALAHILGGHKTIDKTQGLFLSKTWRLHPAICGFTSELFYEGRLSSVPGRERQNIEASGPFSGADLWFVPVDHEGDQTYSVEEVARVAAIVELLTQAGTGWIDQH